MAGGEVLDFVQIALHPSVTLFSVFIADGTLLGHIQKEVNL